MKEKNSLLAIDPGIREIGFAHFLDKELVDYGVKSLRRPKKKRRPLEMLSIVVERMLNEKKPSFIAIEKNSFSRRHPSHEVIRAIQIIEEQAKTKNVGIYEFAASTIKKSVAGDGRATKRTMSKIISANIPELKAYVISNCHWRAAYYGNLFDAVGCGLTYLRLKEDNQLQNHEVSN